MSNLSTTGQCPCYDTFGNTSAPNDRYRLATINQWVIDRLSKKQDKQYEAIGDPDIEASRQTQEAIWETMEKSLRLFKTIDDLFEELGEDNTKPPYAVIYDTYKGLS